MRARIDEQAPRVIPILEKPMVHGLRDGNSFSAEADPEYVLPRMKDARLLFIVTGKLVNEGKGSARVSLNGNGACFITDDDEALFLGEISSSNEQRILSSGESVRFAWSDGHSLQDWVDAYQNPSPPNPHGACFMEVIIRDYLKDGVLDHIHLEMTGRPVVPVEGDEGRWEYGKEDSIVAISYPIHRTYLQEGWKGLTPPWEETYKEWNDQQTTGREEPEVSAKRWHMILSAINRLLTGR